jgi:hypothetical protein
MVALSRIRARLSRMTHPLDGARAKIERAGDHLETLDRAIRRWLEDYGYRMVLEPNVEPGKHRIVMRANRAGGSPPLHLGVIVGDALHDLRSALDHLIWQLVILDGHKPWKRNQFPIFDTPKQFKDERPRYLRGVSTEHRAQIEMYQPYHGGERGVRLSTLARLNDVDKHRVVMVGTPIARTGQGTLGFGPNVTGAQITSKDWTTFEDGAVLYSIDSIDYTGDNVQVQANLAFTVVFGEPDGIATSRRDLIGIRDVIANVVEDFAGEF